MYKVFISKILIIIRLMDITHYLIDIIIVLTLNISHKLYITILSANNVTSTIKKLNKPFCLVQI